MKNEDSDNGRRTKTAFDIGMYDGADTHYYLESGFRVIAVEANPNLIEMASQRFDKHVRSGALKLLNVAIGQARGTLELVVCGTDIGSSSIFAERLATRFPVGSFTVPSITFDDLLAEHGTPDFIKIDIEGADKMCVQALTSATAPAYLSFEAHSDMEELVRHANSVGYRRFKLINQTNFLCLQNQEKLSFRLSRRIIGALGYRDPEFARRAGREFLLGHSSGPAPWESDGRWYDANRILSDWNRAVALGRTAGWYDVHAAR